MTLNDAILAETARRLLPTGPRMDNGNVRVQIQHDPLTGLYRAVLPLGPWHVHLDDALTDAETPGRIVEMVLRDL